MDAQNISLVVDLGRHFVRVAIANQKSGKIIVLEKFRAIFALDNEGLPMIGDLIFNRQVERKNIIADANEDHRFASNVYSQSFCYAQCNDQGQYQISPIDRDDIIQISQQQVIAAFLAKAKSIAEKKYNCIEFANKIIVVPTFASDNYRRVVLQAVQIADYGKKVELLDQMGAVAISYKYQMAKRIQTTDPDFSEHLVAIAIVGARSSEFALFHESPWTCQLELLKCDGQANLGSEDLSETLAKYLLEEYSLKDCGNPNIPGVMFEKCEQAKQNVSMPIQKASVEFAYMDCWGQQNKFRFAFKRKENFDRICESTFMDIKELIEKAFGGSYRTRIDRLFCAGDGCRTLQIQELIANMMAPEHNDLSPNSLEDVAINGAAIYAAVLAKKCAGSLAQETFLGIPHQFEQFYTPQHVYRCIELQQIYKEQNAQWKGILFSHNEKRPTNWREFSYEGNQNIRINDHAGMIMGTMNSEQLEPYSKIKFRLDPNGCLQIGFFYGHDEVPCSAEILLFNQNLLTKNQIEDHNLALTANLPFHTISSISPSKANAPQCSNSMSEIDQNMGISKENNQQNNVDNKRENDGSNKLDLMEGTSSSTKIVESSEHIIQTAKDALLLQNSQKSNVNKEEINALEYFEFFQKGNEEAMKRTLEDACKGIMAHLESLEFPPTIPPFSLVNLHGMHRELMEMCSNPQYSYEFILPVFNQFRQLAECFVCKHTAVDLAKKAGKIVYNNRCVYIIKNDLAFPWKFDIKKLFKNFVSNVEQEETKDGILRHYTQFKNEILANMTRKSFYDFQSLEAHLNYDFPDKFY